MFNTLREVRDSRLMLDDRIEQYGDYAGRQVFWEESEQILRSGSAVNWRRLSMRTIFEEFVPNGRTILHDWDDQARGARRFGRLIEGPVDAMGTSDFSNILGQINYASTLENLNLPQFIGQNLMTTVPGVTQFREIRPEVSMVGAAAVEDVGEGEPYPVVRPSENWITIPAKIKDGFIMAWTRELVQEDNVAMMSQMNRKSSQAMGVNWENERLDAVLGVTTTYSRNGGVVQGTYLDTHTDGDFDNLITTALVDWASLEDAYDRFNGMTDLTTGDPVAIGPAVDLIVPHQLLMTALRIVNATEVRESTSAADPPADGTDTTPIRVTVSANPISAMSQITVHSNQYVSDRLGAASFGTDEWWFGDARAAFEYVEMWPPDMETMDGNSHLGFTRDIVGGVKISRKGVSAAVAPWNMIRSNPA